MCVCMRMDVCVCLDNCLTIKILPTKMYRFYFNLVKEFYMKIENVLDKVITVYNNNKIKQ